MGFIIKIKNILKLILPRILYLSLLDLSRKLYISYIRLTHLSFKKGFHRFTFKKISFLLYLNPSNGYDDFGLYNRKNLVKDSISNYLSRVLKNDSVFVDIGSNNGVYTILSSKLAPKGTIYSFEPIHYLNKKIQKSISKNNSKNIVLHSYACGDKKSEATININPIHTGTSSLIRNNESIHNQKVKVIRADSIIKTKVDLIKIDVEGYELFVLKGLNKLLKKYRPQIIFEFNEDLFEEIHSYLSSFEYRFQTLDGRSFDLKSFEISLKEKKFPSDLVAVKK